MLPTILFQALEHNSEGIEYHVKSNDPEVTHCFSSPMPNCFVTSLSFAFLEYPNGSRVALWTNDGNIQYFSPEHAPLFLVAMAVLLLLWLPYIATIYVYTSIKGLQIFKLLREKIVTRQQDEVHNEQEDVGYELLDMNRQEQGQRGQLRSLVINFDELREPVLEYAD